VVEKVKVMSFEDIAEVRKKQNEKDAAEAEQ